MSTDTSELSGPDLSLGVPLSSLPEGAMLQGHAGGEAVLLVRRDGELFALGAFCTHYGAPLGDGLLVGDTIRCPWHHACFNLRTGGVLRAPARDPLPRWRVEESARHRLCSREAGRAAAPSLPDAAGMPESVVIVGGGAAGNAAAETLRREGYAGRITMLSADQDLPCDRPNLSKNYLAGTAPEDWIPLRTAEFYREHEIDMHLNAQVAPSTSRRGRWSWRTAAGTLMMHCSSPRAPIRCGSIFRAPASATSIICARSPTAGTLSPPR